MDGSKRVFLSQRPTVQFKRKGSSNKKGSWNNSSREPSSGSSQSADTVYRLLCPSKKIGGVIGKGGGIIRSLREETRSKITVADATPGSDERVIIIYSSPAKISREQNSEEDSDKQLEQEHLEPHCAAQDALLKVHGRIVEEDLFRGVTFDGDDNENVVVSRLLVPNNLVGCVIGKRGDVIQKLRSETRANIRVLPADQLPSCAMDTDELVQISGKPYVAKRALYEVSTLLHQNPRKDNPPLGLPTPFSGQGFHRPVAPLTNMLPPVSPMWPIRRPSHSMPSMPWMGEYENRPSAYEPGGFNDDPPGHGGENSDEFSIKILCSTAKIGGVIGKGGFNVKQLQEETGASIHVQDASTDSEERAIHVSAFEALWNPRSQTIEAILQLQNKTSDLSDKGAITTRLLVPSSKVGCILGQGGQIINEMRRRTQADIRVYSKDDRPKCAAKDEELVQISGNAVVVKDALAEITSRLRVRTLRDANAGEERAPVGPPCRFRLPDSLHGGGLPPPPTAVRAGSSGRYDPLQLGIHEYDPENYPIPPASSGHRRISRALDGRSPNNEMDSFKGIGGSNISNIGEVSGPRVKYRDSQSGDPERGFDIRCSDQLNAAQNILQALMASVSQNASAQPSSYHNANTVQGSHQNMNEQNQYPVNGLKSPYQINASAQPSSYHNVNTEQGSYHDMNEQNHYPANAPKSPYLINARKSPYGVNAQQSPYDMHAQHARYKMNAQQRSYQLSVQQGSLPNNNPPQGAYYNFHSQQGAYNY